MTEIKTIDQNPFTEHIDIDKPEAFEQVKELINTHPLAFISFNWERMPAGSIRASLNFLNISCVIIIFTDEPEAVEFFKSKVVLI